MKSKMKSKLFIKILITLLVVLFATSMFNNFVYADNFSLSGFNASEETSIITPIEKTVGAILSLLRIVCTGIAIIMITVIAIKYLSAAPSDRADLKKSGVSVIYCCVNKLFQNIVA